MKSGEIIISMRGITKRFPNILTNDHINLDIRTGEVHALLGENGAGKTTLMNILYGLYQPDEGDIYFRGKKTVVKSPKDAIDLGIGMVHQNFKLIPSFTVVENVILGQHVSKGVLLNINVARKQLTDLCEKYGLNVNLNAEIWQLPVGKRQAVEILKSLYQGAQILILDEPSSVLTPQEIKEFYAMIRRMVGDTLACVVLITHKLHDVLAISDRVTVLTKGKVVFEAETKNVDEETLVMRMVGRKVDINFQREIVGKKVDKNLRQPILEVRGLRASDDRGLLALKGVSFSLNEGEILGVAGITGNGQKELAETIYGLREVSDGKVLLEGKEIANCSVGERINAGIAYVPEERQEIATISELSVKENLMLKLYRDPSFSKGLFFDNNLIDRHIENLMSKFSIITPSKDTKVACLSGGNLQRLILAREVTDKGFKVLIVVYPTSGLDVAASEYIRRELVSLKNAGKAILLISENLDEIISLSDRIAVMFEGRIVGMFPVERATKEEIGLMMTRGG